MNLTDQIFKEIMPNCRLATRTLVLPVLNDTLKEFDISNKKRVAAFLATIAVESGEFRYNEEIWGPTAAQKRYEGRKDLGNIQRGDGKRFMGRGRIQITGRSNYKACGEYFDTDLINNPSLLAEEPLATRSAGWFFSVFKDLNGIADQGDFLKTQIKVNGKNKKTGNPNNWSERLGYYKKALEVLPDNFKIEDEDHSSAKNSDDQPDDGSSNDQASDKTSDKKDDFSTVSKPETKHPDGWSTWKTTLTGIWGSVGVSFTALIAGVTKVVHDPILAKIIVIFGLTLIVVAGLFGLTYLIIRTIHINRTEKFAHELQLKEMDIKANPDLNNVKATMTN